MCNIYGATDTQTQQQQAKLDGAGQTKSATAYEKSKFYSTIALAVLATLFAVFAFLNAHGILGEWLQPSFLYSAEVGYTAAAASAIIPLAILGKYLFCSAPKQD